MDGPVVGRLDGALLVDGLADHVEDAAQGAGAHGHGDGLPVVLHLLPAHQTLRGVHGNRAHHALPDVLRHLQHQARLALLHLHLQRVQHAGQLVVELFIAWMDRGVVGLRRRSAGSVD